MKFYLRMKDENCKLCESYLDPPLTKSTTVLGSWFVKKKEGSEKKFNPHALPQNVIDAVVEGWRVQMEHLREEKMRVEEENERIKEFVASAVEGHEDPSLGYVEEKVVYIESDGETASPGEKECELSFE
jgi:hypothetical protein